MNSLAFHGQQILIAFDQLINACLGGYADETLSSRAHRRRLAGSGGIAEAIDAIASLLGDNEHCRQAYESERLGRQLPPELRDRCNL